MAVSSNSKEQAQQWGQVPAESLSEEPGNTAHQIRMTTMLYSQVLNRSHLTGQVPLLRGQVPCRIQLTERKLALMWLEHQQRQEPQTKQKQRPRPRLRPQQLRRSLLQDMGLNQDHMFDDGIEAVLVRNTSLFRCWISMCFPKESLYLSEYIRF